MKSIRRFSPDLLVLALLLLLPLILFWPVTIGSQTLIPADNLFQWQPWQNQAASYGVEQPHNELLSDLLLENYAWKRFFLQVIEEREIPLWNPNIFAGAPFLASGQHAFYYPFSILYLIFSLPRAYGLFTVSQLFLAGAWMYLLGRVLNMRRIGAALAAVTYQLCGYLLVSVTFPMILAGSAWLPFLLAMIELIIRQQPIPRGRPATLPWVALGAAGLGMQVMAGHGENTYFTLLVMGLYAAWRLAAVGIAQTRADNNRPALKTTLQTVLRPAGWLLVMVILGMGLGAAQFIPFVELVQQNFREGAASLADLLSWAYPPRRIITLLAPNFFGNPSHHSYLNLFSWQNVPVAANLAGDPIAKIDWGIKNYVEGGIYLGILPLLLAALAVLNSLRRTSKHLNRGAIWFFALLALASLSFIFPTGTYAIIHAIPIINQSHSPFRWVFPFSICLAMLAGWGASLIAAGRQEAEADGDGKPVSLPWLTPLTALALAGGGLGLAGLLLSRLFYDTLEPFIERVFLGLARAPEAFPDVRAFYSYEFIQLAILALMLLGAGLVLLLARRRVRLAGRPVWGLAAILLVALDLSLATWNFQPAADPTLLETKPELLQFLQDQPGLWRLTTFTPHGDTPLHANTPWLYDLQDIRGYDSIITRQYVDYMGAIEPQNELLHNRIQPIKRWQSLNSPLLDLLNVRFIVTSEQIELPKLAQVWQGEGLRVYENMAVAPRAFTLPQRATLLADDPLAAMTEYDPRTMVVIANQDALPGMASPAEPATLAPASISHYGSQELFVDVTLHEPGWLVVTDSYFPGWKAYGRPFGGLQSDEQELTITRVDGNFRAVQLDPGNWTVRFKYSPMSFKLGLFISFMAGVIIIFLGGVWLWRLAYRESATDSTLRRVAKNSLAPMVLNLFNRGMDFAFAALMLRILGAENAGKYYVAINIALWFEILGSFGLHTLLMREVAKHKEQANRYLVNTTLLRLLTSLGGALPITLYIVLLTLGGNPLASDTTLAIVLLMVGMIPGGISTGLTALFYAYEKAEIPAAFTTVATILKISLGTLVLLLGMGFVGLAGVSIVVNLVTVVLLGILAVRNFFTPRWECDWDLQRSMFRESFPLMLNHLLATLFFKVDILLLERFNGNTVVGWYSTAYKWIDALNIIPSFFTFAVFPVMSRQAENARDSMLETYQMAIRLLVIVALPIAVITTGVAPMLIRLLGGTEYLPHGAIALQIMIWSIPIGWINSITNYVLIALGQQQRMTRAFVIGVSFNLIANFLFLPRYGYPATAVIAILSELILLIAFYRHLRDALAPIPWLKLLWRPLTITAAMATVTWTGWQAHPVIGILLGAFVFLAGLSLLHVLEPAERQLLSRLLPARLKRD